MENVFLRYLRESKNYTYTIIAKKLKIPSRVYKNMERGELPMTAAQAKILGRLYKIDPTYIIDSGAHYYILLTSRVIISGFKARLESLEKVIKEVLK